MGFGFIENLVVLFALAIFVGVIAFEIWMIRYVYQDASSRNMNASFWAVIVFILNFPLGLLIYIIVRHNFQQNVCPFCGKAVKIGYEHCPYCGETLFHRCRKCGTPLEEDWLSCPRCGEPNYL